MFKTKEKKEEFFNLLSAIISIFILIFLFVSIILTFNKNKEYKKEIAKLIEENNELNGINNELKNLCSLQEEQIELNQIELENCLIQNSKQIEKAFSYIEPLKELNKKEYLKQYKKIIEDYNYFDKPETIYDVYTKEQIDIICRCIETEAYGAHFDGKVNVACVILNRVESDKFPSDPISVIKESNQFAYGRTNISEDTLLALEYAFMIEDTTNGCIAFRSDSSPNKWGNLIYKFTDNVGHSFYYTEERSNDN